MAHLLTRIPLLLGAAACLLSAPAPAQTSPEAAARAFFAAQQEQRWQAAAALVDSAALHRFREGQIEFARAITTPYALSVEDLHRMDPQMPECVAQYQVERSRQSASRAGTHLRQLFAGVSSADELETLPPRELLARYLQAQDPQESMNRFLLERRLELPDSVARLVADSMQARVPHLQRRVLGVVREGDTLAHVLYRVGFSAAGEEEWMEHVQVLPLIRRGRRWYVADVTHAAGTFAWGVDVDLEPEQDP